MHVMTVGRGLLVVALLATAAELAVSSVRAGEATLAAAVVPPARADGRLPPGVTPLSYALDLVLDPAQPRFSGRVRIKVRMESATRAIVLHAKELEVQRAVARTGQSERVATVALRKAAGSKAEREELVLTFDAPVGPGEAELDLTYEGAFGNKMRGLYHVQEKGMWYAFTQFEPTDARRAFPCFDEPGWKTPFTVSLTVPAPSAAFANMKERSRQSVEGGARVRFEFEPSPPLPTYLVALAVGAFDVVSGTTNGLDVRVIAVKGKKDLATSALAKAQGFLGPLARYFARPYPYGKLDLVAVPAFSSGAMENAGLLTFREERLLLDARASLASHLSVSGIIAHELAHQWFGDLVTMAWWDDLWLNEAFASWMADKVVDEVRPATRARLQARLGKSRVMADDALATARRIRNPVGSTSAALEAFDGVTYIKGRSVLAMTEAWLGEDVFRDGIRKYIAQHAWGNATASDLYAALTESSGGRPVARMMETFTTQTGVPLVEAELECGQGEDGRPAGKPAVRLTQREYRTLDRKASPSDKQWEIPVCLAFPASAAPGTRLARQCTMLEAPEAHVELDAADTCPPFVYANAGEDGYYRVRLNPERLTALSLALPRLSEAERFGVVSNAFAAVRSGDLNAPDFLALIAKLPAERSELVWSEIIGGLTAIDHALITDAARPAFARFVRTLGAPLARRLGWRERRGESDDDHFLRERVLRLLGEVGEDGPVLAQAGRYARQWLAGLSRKGGVPAVSNDMARVAVPLSAKHGDATLWQQLAAVVKDAPTPEARVVALSGLIAFEDRALLDRTLGLVLDGTIKAQDLRYVFPAVALRRATRDVALAWIQAHFDEVVPKIPSSVINGVTASLGGVCEASRVRALEAFFVAHTAELEGVAKDLRQSVEAALRCAALADAQRNLTSNWLTLSRN
ncbi:MAG TPA: M1 family aminopeptidase [Polyangia bacterium]|nr:M1 family aminopeptidase [Polyangia bacterium]